MPTEIPPAGFQFSERGSLWMASELTRLVFAAEEFRPQRAEAIAFIDKKGEQTKLSRTVFEERLAAALRTIDFSALENV